MSSPSRPPQRKAHRDRKARKGLGEGPTSPPGTLKTNPPEELLPVPLPKSDKDLPIPRPKKPSKRSWGARLRSATLRFEAIPEAVVVGLRFIELMFFTFLFFAVAVGIGWWVFTGTTPLEAIMVSLSANWQGAVFIFLILLLPTIRDLADRLQELPGGSKVMTREERHRLRQNIEEETDSESEEEA